MATKSYFFYNARGVDTLLTLDDYIMNKSKAFFSRVLVYIYMLSNLSNQILVKRSNFAFISILNEKLPPFCFSYKIVGHDLSNIGKTVLPKHVVVNISLLLLSPRKLTSLIAIRKKFLKREKWGTSQFYNLMIIF